MSFPYKKGFIKKASYYLDNLKDDQILSKHISSVTNDKYVFPIQFVSQESVYDTINTVTDLFTEPARMKASVYGYVSPIHFWETKEKEIRKYAKKEFGKEDAFALRESIYFMTKEATAFSPSISKMLYQIILPKEGGTVFDPFSGWGDRALGAICSSRVLKYTGVDCNPELKEGYQEITDLSEGKVQFYNCSITEFEIKEKYDLIFTSPPFWDYETYNPFDQKQSINGIKSYKDWMTNFMEPVLLKLKTAMKGFLALYMGETYRTKDMPERIIKFLQKNGVEIIHRIDCSVGNRRPVPIYIFQLSPSK